MRNKYILFSATAVLLMGLAAFSFAGNEDDDKKKKKVEKKVEVVNNNGEKTVTVEITENGKTEKKVYKGKEADEYLAKNENGIHHHSSSGNKTIIINIDDEVSGNTDDKNLFMFHHLDDSVFNSEELKKEMEKLKKELQENGINFEWDTKTMGECTKNMNQSMAYAFSFDGHDIEKHIDSIMKTIDIDVNISTEDGKGKKMVISKVIIIDDKDENKKAKKKEITESGVKLYPNPADDTFMLEFDIPTEETAQITVIDINGKTVYSETVSGAKNYKKQVNSSAFADGTYILNIQQGSTTISKKVMIK